MSFDGAVEKSFGHRLVSATRAALTVWGGLSLATVLFGGVAIGLQILAESRDSVDTASKHDVRFVLNWCRLGDERIEKVVHSYVSARSFTGDHLDMYAIKVTHLDVTELEADTDTTRAGWYRCDQLPPVLKETVEFAAGWRKENKTSWFPTREELSSDAIYVYAWSTRFNGVRATAAQLIFARPADDMVFYFEC